MNIGYARVSTADQDLAAQLDELAKAGCERVFQEKISGAKAERPELKELLAFIKTGDVVVVTRLDRLARSTRDLLNILDAISTAGAVFKSISQSWANTDSALGRLVVTILGGIAEFERELIQARTGEGRKRAMAAGVRFGRKPYALTPEQQDTIRQRLAAGERMLPLAAEYGVNRGTIRKLRENVL